MPRMKWGIKTLLGNLCAERNLNEGPSIYQLHIIITQASEYSFIEVYYYNFLDKKSQSFDLE